MDPTTNLREQREVRQAILDRADAFTQGDSIEDYNQGMEDDACRLAELSEALDCWLVKGGFLPADWSKA